MTSICDGCKREFKDVYEKVKHTCNDAGLSRTAAKRAKRGLGNMAQLKPVHRSRIKRR